MFEIYFWYLKTHFWSVWISFKLGQNNLNSNLDICFWLGKDDYLLMLNLGISWKPFKIKLENSKNQNENQNVAGTVSIIIWKYLTYKCYPSGIHGPKPVGPGSVLILEIPEKSQAWISVHGSQDWIPGVDPRTGFQSVDPCYPQWIAEIWFTKSILYRLWSPKFGLLNQSWLPEWLTQTEWWRTD